jgi:hypothetical protein
MSKNIVIQEGGIGKQLTVDKLKTNEVGGGTCLWIPEDEALLAQKTITENGTYKAKDDGLYGYSEVVVDVPGGSGSSTPGGTGSSIVGKDSNGNDVLATIDTNGNIVETVLPEYIKVITPPDADYFIDGDPIDLDGIVVKAYTKDDELWEHEGYSGGVIPVSELVADPANADITQAIEDEWDVTGLGLNSPVYMAEVHQGDTYEGEVGETESRIFTELYKSAPVYMIQMEIDWAESTYYTSGFVSLQPFRGQTRRVAPPAWDPQIQDVSAHLVTVGNYSAYVNWRKVVGQSAAMNVGITAKQNSPLDEVATIALCGGSILAGKQKINVNWNRYGNTGVLSDSFNITVAEDE